METVKRSVLTRGSSGWKEGLIGGAQGLYRAVKLFCMIHNDG